MKQTRQPEIQYLQPSVRSKPQVPRLEIAMNYPLLVRCRQTRSKLRSQPLHFFQRKASLRQPLVQRQPRHVLHHQEIDAVFAVEIVDRTDIGMIQPR
jgi:hypothetical protein